VNRQLDRFSWAEDEVRPVGICARCVHLDRKGLGCDAFPEGIPRAILLGDVDHHYPVEGDRGIQFEERQEVG
jgi:hypothetical protein